MGARVNAGFRLRRGAKQPNVPTACTECGTPLDAETLASVQLDPEFFRGGVIGRCCHGPDDDGWGDAPRYVDGPGD